MDFFFKYKLTFIGLALGAVAGFLYFYFVGCGESCNIYSDPFNSTGYGAVMGGLIFNIFEKGDKKSKKEKED